MNLRSAHGRCLTCGRALDDPLDPLSADCGGDCWGCVGKIEADAFETISMARVELERRGGLRTPGESGPPPEMVAAELEDALRAIIEASPQLMHVLTTVRDLDLPDWRVFSGAIYQTAWNALTWRDPIYGLKDYDVGYFDASDVSYEAEDVVIRQVAAVFEPPLRDLVEVRNQARVHVWFENRFGEPYSPLSCTDEALARFVAPAFAVGARLERDGRISIAAPFGLEDLFALRLRPNPTRGKAKGFERAVGSARARWPEIEVLEA